VDCDRTGWNSSEIISPLVSLGCSLSADPNIRGLLQGEHPEILAQSDPPPVDLSVGDIRSQIAAEWLQIAQRSQWRAYRKPPSLFRMVPSLTPYDLPFPKMGIPYTPRYANGDIFATDDPIHFMFGSTVGNSGSADRMVLFLQNLVTSNPSWRQAAILDNFEWPYLRNGSCDPLIYRASRGHLCDSTAFLYYLLQHSCYFHIFYSRLGLLYFVFTARCTLVQSAVLRSHVVCLSFRLSVTLVDCDYIGRNSSKIISPLVSLRCSLFATQT